MAEAKREREALLAMTAAPSSSEVDLRIVGVLLPTGAIVQYVTSQVNQPKSYANQLYVWESSSPNVPWDAEPDGVSPIAKDSPMGTQQLDFDWKVQTGYVIGYSVAADPGATCATVYVPGDAHQDPSAWVSNNLTVRVPYFGNNLVQVSYDGLGNYDPAANHNWVGLWELGHVPYSGPNIGATKITRPQNSGVAVLQDVDIRIGSIYSVGYFMAAEPGGRTALAASATFST